MTPAATQSAPTPERILVWMCVLVAVNQLGFGAMIPTLALYAQSFGVPASAIGLAVASYGLARFFSAMPTAHWADRLGRRPTLAVGGLISAAGNLWCAVATGYPEFLFARFVAGFGAGVILTAGQVVLADISPPERRGRMISIYQGTFLFAVGVGPFPGGLLAEYYGLAAPFAAYGIASLLATAVAWLAVAETKAFSRSGVISSAALPPLTQQLRLLTGQIGFLLVSVIAFMNAVVRTGGLFAIIPVVAKDQLGISVGRVGFAMMIGSIAGLAVTYPAGSLADRFGRKAVIVPATLITGISMLLFGFGTTYTWFLAACIVWSISISVGGAAPAAYVADSAPPGMNAAAMSTYRMMADAGYVVGPPLLGIIVDTSGTVTALVAASAMLLASGAAFWAWAPETKKSS